MLFAHACRRNGYEAGGIAEWGAFEAHGGVGKWGSVKRAANGVAGTAINQVSCSASSIECLYFNILDSSFAF
jgi:hypothetical protein